MARRKSASVNDGLNPVDRMFADFSQSFRNEWGTSVYVNGDEESRVICLKVPLALQYLLQQEGFTLGRFTMLVGLPESCKSAFSYELCRLHRVASGGFSLIETEKKDSPTLMKSTVGYDPGRYTVTYVKTAEEWQSCLKDSMETLKVSMEKRLSPPCSIPWLWVVDSLAGVTTQHLSEKVDEEGSATLVQPHLANMISQFMKVMNHWFDAYPFSVVGINHLKLKPDRYGNMNVRSLQGGYAPRFAESLEIELHRVDKKQIDRRLGRREQGIRLGLTVAKNSTAAHAQQVIVEMLWYFEDVTLPDGRVVELQRTYWDWPSAAIEILSKPPVDAAAVKQINAVVDLHASGKERMVWSDALGIKESDPLSYHEAGVLLEAREDLCVQLYKPLGIRRRHMFVPGVAYAEQRATAAVNAVRIAGDGMPKVTTRDLPEDPQRE
jgi:RecA/RadA recombinase